MTPQELQFAALRELGVATLTEPPSAEHGVYAADTYASLHAMLLAEGLVAWALVEAIPAKYCQPVIWMLAFLMASGETLGVPDEIKQAMAAMGSFLAPQISLGERQLRRLMADPYISQTATSDFY